MHKVININLNGNAYQVEEPGYELLSQYLAEARRQLGNNPDVSEILLDLEQAIADKCRRFMRSGKNVVLLSEVQAIIEEMGPVADMEGSDAGTEHAFTAGHGQSGQGATASSYETLSVSRPRKLYRLQNDKMVEGICSGLGAYLGIDPTIVRIIFVILLIMTSGVLALVYLVLALFIPEAKTPEEHAAAHGAPFDAQEVLQRAKANVRQFQADMSKGQNRKANADYWKENTKTGRSGVGTLLTIIVCVMAISFILKFFHFPFSTFMYMDTGYRPFSFWISLIIFLLLIYGLSRLVKNLSESGRTSGTVITGVLKFCLVVLCVIFVIQFAVHIIPVIGMLFAMIVAGIHNLLMWIF